MAGTLKDDLAPLLDELRGLPGELGFRPFQVSVRVETWSGPRSGLGSKTVEETRLFVGNRQNPKVQEVHLKDVTAEHVDALYDIGPLTPKYGGGGISETVLKPEVEGPNVEVFYIVKGKGTPPNGWLCKRVSAKMDRSLRNFVRVQSTGREA